MVRKPVAIVTELEIEDDPKLLELKQSLIDAEKEAQEAQEGGGKLIPDTVIAPNDDKLTPSPSPPVPPPPEAKPPSDDHPMPGDPGEDGDLPTHDPEDLPGMPDDGPGEPEPGPSGPEKPGPEGPEKPGRRGRKPSKGKKRLRRSKLRRRRREIARRVGRRVARKTRQGRTLARKGLNIMALAGAMSLVKQSADEYEKLVIRTDKVSRQLGIGFNAAKAPMEKARTKYGYLRDELFTAHGAMIRGANLSWIPDLPEMARMGRLTGQTPFATASFAARMSNFGELGGDWFSSVYEKGVTFSGYRAENERYQRDIYQVQKAIGGMVPNVGRDKAAVLLAWTAREIGGAGEEIQLDAPLEEGQEIPVAPVTRYRGLGMGTIAAGLQRAVGVMPSGGGMPAAMMMEAAAGEPLGKQSWRALRGKAQEGGLGMISGMAKQITKQWGTGDTGRLAFHGAINKAGNKMSYRLAGDVFDVAQTAPEGEVKKLMQQAPGMTGAATGGRLAPAKTKAAIQKGKEGIGSYVWPVKKEVMKMTSLFIQEIMDGISYANALSDSMRGASDAAKAWFESMGMATAGDWTKGGGMGFLGHVGRTLTSPFGAYQAMAENILIFYNTIKQVGASGPEKAVETAKRLSRVGITREKTPGAVGALIRIGQGRKNVTSVPSNNLMGNWCGIFIAGMLRGAGLPDDRIRDPKTNQLFWAHTKNMEDWADRDTQNVKRIKIDGNSKNLTFLPLPGDIITMDGDSYGKHFALVVNYDKETGKFETIEGNTTAKGSRSALQGKSRNISRVRRLYRPRWN